MDEKAGLKFKTFFFFKHVGQGVLYPFMVLYLIDRGISGAEMGMLLMLLPLGKVVLSPAVGYLCDLYRLHKPVLVLSVLLNALGGFFLYIGEPTLAAFLAAVGVITLGETGSDTLSISLAMDYLSQNNRQTDYGRWRLWGAVGYMSGSLALGFFVLDQYLEIMPLVFAGANFIAVLAALMLPKGSGKKPMDYLGGLKMLKKTPSFVTLLIGIMVSGLAFNIVQSYYTVYMDIIGAAGLMLGIGVAWQVVIEIILSANTKAIIDRFSLRHVYLLGFALLPLRALLFLFNRNPVMGLVIQNLHGFYIFSAFIIGFLILDMKLDPEWRSTGQSYYISAFGGFGGMMGMFIAPIIFDAKGIRAVWAFAAAAAFAGFLLIRQAARRMIPD
jgi:PPP family 3-phenylpropionic acid transporter